MRDNGQSGWELMDRTVGGIGRGGSNGKRGGGEGRRERRDLQKYPIIVESSTPSSSWSLLLFVGDGVMICLCSGD